MWVRADLRQVSACSPGGVEAMTGPQHELLACPKCGSEHRGPYAVLGHITTEHWIVDDDELPEGWSR